MRSFTFAGVEVGIEPSDDGTAFHPPAIRVSPTGGDTRAALRDLAIKLRAMADDIDCVVASPRLEAP